MKGIIFRGLEELVVTSHDIAVWEKLLEKHAPADRVYVSAKNYPDEELFALAQEVAIVVDKPLPDVLRTFGEFLFTYLTHKHREILDQFDGFSSLIMSIDTVIHAEVAKLYHEPNLPEIRCERIDDSHILMFYCSKRKLCFCAEGLINGAAQYYQINVNIEHQKCMHQGAAECTLLLSFGEKKHG
ncbi:heme NO-binding domain-containing protein [Pseudoalteromonas sp. MMG022]|uniref:heme NO-binding domain-containing protein n=1 Tax=Pseudoalteromonas sp. MMG022 TaxID=2909978 RepID=UPI001F468201|nr:heme NO-binding domain-containing protein [Pseudoalteromonas sp. MMG022]MCF6437260.1 heme NO-binding domain-containing protein [Pseudoalteromonas sp. MMG022]